MTSKAAVPTEAPAEVAELPEDLAAVLSPMLGLIPDGEGDAFGIFSRLLNADTVEGLNVEGSLPSAQDLAPFRVVVKSLTKHQSDMGGAIPVYLVVEGVLPETGETIRFQTSAGVPFVVMVKLFAMGKLPAELYITKSDKVTKAGYRPLNVKVLASGLKL